TIGIRPHFPHTGYGYIKRGQPIGEGFEVQEFKEKPDFQTAKSYLASGEFYWNAGMFMAPIKVLMSEFKKCSPELYQYVDKIQESIEDEDKTEETYLKMPELSIDYAVMEKSKAVKVLEAEFDWNDLGSWEAMESVIEPTENNTLIKQQGHYLANATGNIVYAPNKFVSLVNIKDLIVVVNDDVLMVLPKEDSQKVKEIVSYIKQNKDESLQTLI
ncbi:MAG: sugar phosphate nucleotidyltransferase, partial [Bdellovibrionales bacterium]|nr:sugar phosphate nucleotidyltransferase [Bdellovibrionales bacterium]